MTVRGFLAKGEQPGPTQEIPIHRHASFMVLAKAHQVSAPILTCTCLTGNKATEISGLKLVRISDSGPVHRCLMLTAATYTSAMWCKMLHFHAYLALVYMH